MPDETTFELASVQFGAEPVAVFRFGYERFELRARLGSEMTLSLSWHKPRRGTNPRKGRQGGRHERLRESFP